jgi:hypothetical protein
VPKKSTFDKVSIFEKNMWFNFLGLGEVAKQISRLYEAAFHSYSHFQAACSGRGAFWSFDPNRPTKMAVTLERNFVEPWNLFCDLPEKQGIEPHILFENWNFVKNVDFFGHHAKKFAYFKISKKLQIKVRIDEGNTFPIEHFSIRPLFEIEKRQKRPFCGWP